MRLFYLARIDCSIENANSRHVTEFCRHFAKLGHEVTLFLPDLGTRKNLENVSTVYIPVLIRNPVVTFFSFYLVLLLLFPFYYFKLRPDVVYTRHQQMEWLTTWLRYVFKFLYVIEVNGLSTVELKISRKPGWVIAVTRLLERFNMRFSHLIVTPSPRIREFLCRNYALDPAKFLDVTNGADPELFRPMDGEQCRKKLGLPVEGNILLFSGSFKKWHGIGEVVRVFPQLLKNVPHTRLLLVGDGEEKEIIQKIISENGLEDRILLMGRRPFEEIPEIINSADLCLAPYFDELLNETGISPIKMYEYMACGKPVISSPVGGLEKLFEGYHVGMLVSSSKPADWAAALEKALNDPERLKEWGENGRRAVLREFSWEAICRKIDSAIEAIRVS